MGDEKSSALGWASLGVSAAGGLATGLSSAFADNDPGSYHLTPEYEMQMLAEFQNSITQYQQYQDQNRQLFDAYNQRVEALSGMISGALPSQEGLKYLTESTQKIAMAFGGDAEAMAKAGFMDSYTKEYMDQAKAEYANIGTTNNTNPVLEAQLADQRRQLEQDLARSGVGPAQRSIALRQFEQSALSQRFEANNQTSAARLGALSTMQGNVLQARGQNYNQALGGYGAQFNFLQNQQGMFQSGTAALGNLYGQQYQFGQQYLNTADQLSQRNTQMYQTLGQYDLSKATRYAIESGLVGPGSVMQQTGVSRNNTVGYKDYIRDQENAGGPVSYGPASYNAKALTYYERLNQTAMQQPGRFVGGRGIIKEANPFVASLGGGMSRYTFQR